jgi:hypothetical protein
MDTRIQIVAIAVTAGLFATVFELVRRRALMERYALLWLFSSALLLALAVWRNLLETISSAVGIYYAPSALFVIAFGFILVLLLHFSIAVSRLADQSKVLAQRLAVLERRQQDLEQGGAGQEDASAAGTKPEDEALVTSGEL